MMNPTRRCVLNAGANGLLAAATLALGVNGASAESAWQRPNKAVIEKWMSTWMGSQKALGAPLRLSRFKDPTYFLLSPISWFPGLGQVGEFEPVTVPTGFVTDFASIPQIFWSILKPDGDYAYAAVVHDYLYWTQTRPRAVADQILKFGMQDLGIDEGTIGAIYVPVRAAGWIPWNRNARRPEKKILKRYPQDPRITWSEWKIDPANFE